MMTRLITHAVILSAVAAAITARIQIDIDNDEAKLLNNVFGDSYDKNLRPVMNKKENITVTFGLTLNQIMDMIEKYEILQLSLYVRQTWYNALTTWNASEYGGIQQVNIDPLELWKPDIYLYNNADSGFDSSLYGFKAKIKVSSNGKNAWLAPIILTSSCKIDVTYFPFDQQNCKLKFGSWSYDAASVDIVAEGPSASLKEYQQNGEWDLLGFPCIRKSYKYVCCPNNFSDVTCTLQIRRRTLYYWFNLIIPCMLITVMSLLSFMVSTESGERITLVITNLLALTVFMLIVADLLPPTSEVVPLISVYITCSIFEVGMALVATCVVLMCYNTNPDIQEMPLWMRYFICQRLGKLLRVQRIKDKKAEQEAMEDSTDAGLPRIQPRNMLFGFGSLPVPRSETYEKLFNTAAGEKTCQLCKDSKEAAYASSRPASQFFQEAAMYKLPEGKPYESQARNINASISTFAAPSLYQEPVPDCRNDCPCGTMAPVLPVLSAIIHRQDHMVRGIKKLTDNLKDEEDMGGDRDEWIYAAHVLDRLLLYTFILTLLSSTLFIFTMVPSYD